MASLDARPPLAPPPGPDAAPSPSADAGSDAAAAAVDVRASGDVGSARDTPPIQPPTGATISFSKQILPILQSRCAFAGCHGQMAQKMLQFNGGSGGPYDELMEKSSRSPLCTGARRVVPGDPDNSLLVAKVKGTQMMICPRVAPELNQRMPKPGPGPEGYLPDEQIKWFEDWVRQGASNN